MRKDEIVRELGTATPLPSRFFGVHRVHASHIGVVAREVAGYDQFQY